MLAVVVLAGFAWAKWVPYAGRASTLAGTHTWSGSSIFVGAGSAPSLTGALRFTGAYAAAVWPAAVVGITVGAALESLVPRHWLVRLLARRSRLAQGVAGGVLALPTMMCSCCTAPVASSLRRRGVPVGAAVAYWLGNPLLNPAVFLFLALTLPWPFVAVRAGVGAAVVLLAAVLAARWAPDTGVRPMVTDEVGPTSVAALLRRFAVTLARYVGIIVPEYLVLVFLTGLLSGWLSDWAGLGAAGGPLALLVVGVVGAILVIPTGGEIPVIVGLVAAGASMGVAGVLLITLPALSLPSLVMVARSFGWRALLPTTLVVVAGGVTAGGLLLALG
ncbi:membrane protein [Tersicoccus solisilvae]|uniref:Membrane protein n=1 Tax=Tersicoccus solisilvae TaxID=1882339 RepID=A0ABQ1P3N3_9MICC|nr:membrane protein [Tersicoccus solisilvae]